MDVWCVCVRVCMCWGGEVGWVGGRVKARQKKNISASKAELVK